jgi:LPXTG-site transpeptidase (sortase) family protein
MNDILSLSQWSKSLRVIIAGIIITFAWFGTTIVTAHEDTGAVISIPSIGVNAPVVRLGLRQFANGDVTWDTSTITTQVGHLDGMGWFGQAGNTVLGGHSELAGRSPAVFYDLDKVEIGDEIVVTIGDTVYRYTVTRTFEVGQRDLSILYPTNNEQLTIMTCDTDSLSGGQYVRRTVIVAERAG